MRSLPSCLLIALLGAAPAAGAATTGSVSFLPLVRRDLGSRPFPGVDHQQGQGFSLNVRGEQWPVSVFVLGSRTSRTSHYGATVRNTMNDIDVGVGRTWRPERRFRPWVAGGLAWTQVAIRVESYSDPGPGPGIVRHHTDSSFGGFADAGVSWRLLRHLDLGLDVRHVRGGDADPTPAGKVDSWTQWGVQIGWGW